MCHGAAESCHGLRHGSCRETSLDCSSGGIEHSSTRSQALTVWQPSPSSAHAKGRCGLSSAACRRASTTPGRLQHSTRRRARQLACLTSCTRLCTHSGGANNEAKVPQQAAVMLRDMCFASHMTGCRSLRARSHLNAVSHALSPNRCGQLFFTYTVNPTCCKSSHALQW